MVWDCAKCKFGKSKCKERCACSKIGYYYVKLSWKLKTLYISKEAIPHELFLYQFSQVSSRPYVLLDGACAANRRHCTSLAKHFQLADSFSPFFCYFYHLIRLSEKFSRFVENN